jgi:hypothetical protein
MQPAGEQVNDQKGDKSECQRQQGVSEPFVQNAPRSGEAWQMQIEDIRI